MPKLHESITQDRIADLIDRAETTLDSPGLCAACGADAEDVEPDATKTNCECCGKPADCGAALSVPRPGFRQGRCLI